LRKKPLTILLPDYTYSENVLLAGNANFDHEAAFGTIGGADAARVEADGAVGNGQADAETSGGALAGVVKPVEGLEDSLELFGRDACAMVHDADHGLAAGWSGFAVKGDFNRGFVGGVLKSVANNILEGAVE